MLLFLNLCILYSASRIYAICCMLYDFSLPRYQYASLQESRL